MTDPLKSAFKNLATIATTINVCNSKVKDNIPLKTNFFESLCNLSEQLKDFIHSGKMADVYLLSFHGQHTSIGSR